MTTEVTRYDEPNGDHAGMRTHPEGDFVRFEDYQLALDKLALRTRQLTEAEAYIRQLEER